MCVRVCDDSSVSYFFFQQQLYRRLTWEQACHICVISKWHMVGEERGKEERKERGKKRKKRCGTYKADVETAGAQRHFYAYLRR